MLDCSPYPASFLACTTSPPAPSQTQSYLNFGFEWVAGTKIKAPEFMANLGLEWSIILVQ